MHYDRDSIQIVDVVKGIRERREMFLPPDRPTGEYLAELITFASGSYNLPVEASALTSVMNEFEFTSLAC